MDPILWAVNLSHFCKKMASSTLPQHLTTQVQVVWLSERYRLLSKGWRNRVTVLLTAKLARFLLSYPINPQSTTGESLAQLRWGRSLRSHLHLLRPDVAIRVHLAQSRQKKQHDQPSRTRGVKLGDAVSVRNYSRGSKWVPGTIIQETGPLSARVELQDGMVVRRHHDQLISRTTEPLCPTPTSSKDRP